MSNTFSRMKDWIAIKYGQDPSRMLIHTGVIGWILSSAAQVVAIAINDKIPKEQKVFLIPQEIADAGVNIASFFLINQALTLFTKKLVRTGKLLPDSVRKKLKTTPGNYDFNVRTSLAGQSETLDTFEKFDKGMGVIATTVGSVLSSNIVTPIIRNKIAANRQKAILENYDNKKNNTTPYPSKRHTINDFMTPKSEFKSYLYSPTSHTLLRPTCNLSS